MQQDGSQSPEGQTETENKSEAAISRLALFLGGYPCRDQFSTPLAHTAAALPGHSTRVRAPAGGNT